MNAASSLLDGSTRDGVVFHQVVRPGFLRVSGADCRDFIQRQTTNDVRILDDGKTLLTCLTSPLGRILDVWCLFHEPDSLAVVTLPGSGDKTFAYLRSRIFFMDKVSIQDLSGDFIQLHLLGPRAAQMIRRLGLDLHLEPGQSGRISRHEGELLVWMDHPALLPGYGVLAPVESAGSLLEELENEGAFQLDEAGYQALRVELGLPSAGAELTEDFTPFEVGLAAAVSDQKGCYTGQEVLARQVTYDKVTQRLVGLRLESVIQPGERLWTEDEKPAGKLTSVVISRNWGPIALAVVKRPFDQEGFILQAGEGSRVQGRVVNLPFR